MPEAEDLRFGYAGRDVQVVFGAGVRRDLALHLDRLGLARVLLITTPGRAGPGAELGALVGARLAGMFDRAAPHVPAAAAAAAVALARELRADACATLGGGSAVGLGKAVALATGLPLVALPTTCAGSEMTAIWGISDGGAKRTGRDARVAPRLVLYDPELTLDLPPAAAAASGMNAAAHCVEALYAADASPVSDLLADDGLRRLARSLPRVVAAPRDLPARATALCGAHLAGRALDLTSMGLHHKLCHVLGGSFGLPHAETHAVLLPYVTAFNAAAAPGAMARIAAALGADRAAEGLHALARALGTPASLAALGLTAADVPRAAMLAAAGGYPNPRPVTEAAVRAVLEQALAGDAPRAG